MVNDEKLKGLEEYLSGQSIADFLDKITERTERNYYCPFHVEKIPSMSVDDTRGVFKCFSCGRSGGLAKLIFYLKEIDSPGISYYDAMEEFLKDSPDVCAELGFFSLQDSYFSIQRVSREYTKILLEGLSRDSRTSFVDNFDLKLTGESDEDVLKRMYLKQKSITISEDNI